VVNNTRRLYEAMIKVKKFSLKVGVRIITHNEQLALDELLGGPNGETKLTITELSQRFNASMPAASRLVKQLEEKGLASRVTDIEDRRFTYVVATEKGKDAYQRNTALLSDILGSSIMGFPEEEMNGFLDMFDRLYVEVEKELSKHDPVEQEQE